MFTTLVLSSAASRRLKRAQDWLGELDCTAPALIVGGSLEAANALVRGCVTRSGRGVIGWHRCTLNHLATALASPVLAAENVTRVSHLGREAVVARVIHELAEAGELGRYQAVHSRPGLPRALVSTLEELRLGSIDLSALLFSQDLQRIYRGYLSRLDTFRLADRTRVLDTATRVVEAGEHPLVGLPTLLLDCSVFSAAEARFIRAIGARAPLGMATVAEGDERTLAHLREALGLTRVTRLKPSGTATLARVQQHLFGADPPQGEAGEDVRFVSAPGESRECVEIARAVLKEVGQGVPFDRIAVLLRSPPEYRAHLVEAFRRAQIPAHFAEGTRHPDPAGRAMMALLACASEGLSASRFAEYMSLGELPAVDAEGAPPAAAPESDAWSAADDPDTTPRLGERQEGADQDEGAEGSVGSPPRTPRRWEQLLVDAAVIGGRDRWERRLAGVQRELEDRIATLDDEDDPLGAFLQRQIADLDGLRRFALPLLDDLAALPEQATWGEWLEDLRVLAGRALRHPETVWRALAELGPMAEVGPVGIAEVQLVLLRRLSELNKPSVASAAGSVYVAPVEAARGLAFDVVFVPGLAERIFPRRVREDPILLDQDRQDLGVDMVTQEHRAHEERLALRLAVGAASRRLVLSYPRLDTEKARPRVPSFYGLEVLRAAEGRLPGFEDLKRRAARGGAPRVGWPAPDEPLQAIDVAEYDLATLDEIFRLGPAAAAGAGRYLLSDEANPHLPRALRNRARRNIPVRWNNSDGLVDADPSALEALAAHGLEARSFSATALQHFAACPYRFLLYTVHKLQPREVPEALEEMDALSRGSMIHEIHELLLRELSDAGQLPVTAANLPAARERLERILLAVEAEYRDRLAPAIERVWQDGIDLIRADVREWLARLVEEPDWVPWRFELAFGLSGQMAARDPNSVPEPVQLENGLRLRGSIDLVEKGPGDQVRATDYKTGKVWMKKDAVIDGGKVLQPVLYALALEKLLPDSDVVSGRLHYCTARGGFQERVVDLDPIARSAANHLAASIRHAMEKGQLPTAPAERACRYCDYQVVCGADEERRTANKNRLAIHDLVELRNRP